MIPNLKTWIMSSNNSILIFLVYLVWDYPIEALSFWFKTKGFFSTWQSDALKRLEVFMSIVVFGGMSFEKLSFDVKIKKHKFPEKRWNNWYARSENRWEEEKSELFRNLKIPKLCQNHKNHFRIPYGQYASRNRKKEKQSPRKSVDLKGRGLN